MCDDKAAISFLKYDHLFKVKKSLPIEALFIWDCMHQSPTNIVFIQQGLYQSQ